MQLLFALLIDPALPKDDRELKGTDGERENILTEPSSMIIIFPTDYFADAALAVHKGQQIVAIEPQPSQP